MDLSAHNLAAHNSERDDRRVLSFGEWCQLNAISVWTGRRIIKAGQGPRVLQLSDRRIGITIAANREWQQARERT
jgi:predicted DNA-binding transcriptional regulator AlpA